MSTIILTELYGQLSLSFHGESSSERQKQIYQDILDYIKTNISKPLRISEIAAHFGYNEKYLSHRFAEVFDIPLKQYILKAKIEQANFLLTDTNKSISEIARELGFSDNHNFPHLQKTHRALPQRIPEYLFQTAVVSCVGMDLSIPSKNALLVISIHMFYNILHIIFPFSPERSLTGMYIRKIVLADDEGTQLKILSSLIHKLTPQTELVLCSDGYAAWEAVQAGDTELLITDIRMPSMDGIELIRQVSEAYPMTAIVLISAWQEFDYAQSAIACGVSEYLVKPFRVEDIRKLLSKMETKISSMQKEQERSLGYEALLEQHLRESRQSLLLSLMYGRPCGETTFESPLLHSLSASLSAPGVMAVLRWEVRPGSSSASSPFALSRPRMETLTEYIHRLFPTDFLVPLDNSLSSSERRLALLLPGFSLAGCISSFERLISLCRAEDIVFQAGLSKEHPDLFAALNTALCQAEEALSFSFYFPGKTTLFDCHKPDSAPAMFSLSGFEKNIRRAVHTGNCEEIQQSLSLLEKELSQEPFKAPARVKHGVSSLAVSVIKDLDGMIPQKEYDSVLDDAYYLYSGCNSLTELFTISLRLFQ